MMHRGIVLVDGENLVMRYQSMKKDGYKPKPRVQHNESVFVWHRDALSWPTMSISRVLYYTTVGHDDKKVKAVKELIASSDYFWHDPGNKPSRGYEWNGTLVPRVFKKEEQGKSISMVDISIIIDAMRYSFTQNIEVICLLSGDADFVPLIEDIMQRDKQVKVGAFSSGLSPVLKSTPDDFHCLDEFFFDLSDSPAQ